MIYDSITNARRYTALGGRVALGLGAIPGHLGKEPGKYEIDGDNVYLLVQKYISKPYAESKWESHRDYIDIHYVENGEERIGFPGIGDLTATTSYEADGDYTLYAGEGNMLVCGRGHFALIFAEEQHMPCVAAGEPSVVDKIVVKVKV